jgi:nitrogen fixation NifU-like protein
VAKVFKTSGEGKKPTTTEIVRQRLRSVINPLTGPSVARSDMVKDIKVKGGIVIVLVDLPRDHQFAHTINEEILEKIEPLWDVKHAVVKFTEQITG